MEKNVIDLDKALCDIKSVIEKSSSPFFFIVGAGVSAGAIPCSDDIINDCKIKVKQKYNDIIYDGICHEAAQLDSKNKEYSFWFEQAYPNDNERKEYLANIMQNAKITPANMQLAHILLNKKISSIVVTPNFDDQIEKSLYFLGEYDYYVSRNKIDNLGIDLNSPNIQIIHVHGTYKTYDCCNLDYEVKNVSHKQDILSMPKILEQILVNNMSPIIIGYSGWEEDCIMTQLKKRLKINIPYNYYWFCYSRKDYENLPSWLKKDKKVVFILPSNNSENLD
jgi:hypothetical protein